MIAVATVLVVLVFVGAPIVAIFDKTRRGWWLLLGGIAGLIAVLAYFGVLASAHYSGHLGAPAR
jgi:hypothetical protein